MEIKGLEEEKEQMIANNKDLETRIIENERIFKE